MFFFGKKESEIIKSFMKHLDAVEETLESFREFMDAYLDGREDFEDLAMKTINAESAADRLRRETETMMYSGAFLPNFRGDLLGLIEAVDVIADRAETVARLVNLQRTDFPEDIRGDIRKQVGVSIKAYKALKRAIRTMFEDVDEAAECVVETEKLEHQEDEIEWQLIKKLFSLDVERAVKLEVREVIGLIGDIADLSEDASDRVEIILLKRRV